MSFRGGLWGSGKHTFSIYSEARTLRGTHTHTRTYTHILNAAGIALTTTLFTGVGLGLGAHSAHMRLAKLKHFDIVVGAFGARTPILCMVFILVPI